MLGDEEAQISVRMLLTTVVKKTLCSFQTTPETKKGQGRTKRVYFNPTIS